MTPMDTSFLSFARSLEGLKKLIRYRGQFFWKDYPELSRYESVADHTWRLAMLVLTLKDHLAQPINLEKALSMAIIHDVAEIIAGDESPLGTDGTGKDTHAYNAMRAEERHKREKRAAQQLFGALPEAEAKRMFQLWGMYEAQDCFEAKVIRALDKIEAMLQVLEYRNGEMFPEHLEFTINYGSKYADVDPAVRAFADEIAGEMRKKFKPYEQPPNPPRTTRGA